MALRACSECGHEVSSRAFKCQRCGAPVVTPAARVIWIVAALLFAVLVIIVAAQS